MTVTPGFIDTHCHVSGVNELYSVNANVRRVRELLANLEQKADKTPAGQWVSAVMFDDTKLDVPLTRQHLDEVSKEHPIVVGHRGGHTSWYNTKAFELAGITKSTPDPDHGRFFRDENGELTGRVAELARNVFSKVGTRETFTPEQQRERGRNGMRHISELLTAAGLTSRARRRRRSRPHPGLRGRARQRRAAPSRLLPRPRQRHVRRLQGRRHLLRLRRRVDSRRRREVRRRRLGVRAHDAHEHAVCRHQRLRHPDDDAAGDRRGGRRRAPPQLPRRHPRQRRRHHRHGAEGVREGPREVSAARHPAPHRALLARQSRSAPPHQGDRRDPDAVLDLRALPRREVEGIRPREDAVDVRAQVVPRHRHPGARRVGLRPRTVRAADGAFRAWSRARTTTATCGGRGRR